MPALLQAQKDYHLLQRFWPLLLLSSLVWPHQRVHFLQRLALSSQV
jgi:hypothetical protein